MYNSAFGTVIDIIYDINLLPPHQPKYILVLFDKFDAEGFENQKRLVVIQALEFKSYTNGKYSRTMFPLRNGNSGTIHST